MEARYQPVSRQFCYTVDMQMTRTSTANASKRSHHKASTIPCLRMASQARIARAAIASLRLQQRSVLHQQAQPAHQKARPSNEMEVTMKDREHSKLLRLSTAAQI